MRLTKPLPMIVGAVVALAAIGGWLLVPRPTELMGAPEGSIYYTGPMMQKGKKLPRPTKVHIVVGDPIVVPAKGGRASRSAVHRLTMELQEQLQSLFDTAQKRAAV